MLVFEIKYADSTRININNNAYRENICISTSNLSPEIETVWHVKSFAIQTHRKKKNGFSTLKFIKTFVISMPIILNHYYYISKVEIWKDFVSKQFI